MFERVLALGWADMFVTYAMWTAMTYLTDVWKLAFTRAATIVNVYVGLMQLLPLFLQVVVDALIGHYWMLLSSSVAYFLGMGFLTMSTPPLLYKVSGTCGSYLPECVGDTQRILFYIALPFLAVGSAGYAVSLADYMREQYEHLGESKKSNDDIEEEQSDDDTETKPIKFRTVSCYIGCASRVALYAGAISTFFWFPYIKPWSLHFGIPAIGILVATLFFLSGSFTYFNDTARQDSHITTMVRVLVASASKLFHHHPSDPKALHGSTVPRRTSIPRVRGLGWLNKAAIVLPDKPVEEQQKDRWKLCTVTEIQNTKYMISMIPMAIPFIFMGLLSLLGQTFFVEQAKNMNPKVGKLTISVTMFWYVYFTGRQFSSSLASCFEMSGLDAKGRAPIAGPLVSIILGVLCCVTAAKVESRRLDVVKSHGLLDKPDETIPMSVFWLFPQLFFLGAAEEMSQSCAASFIKTELIGRISNSLGCIGSVLAMFVVGKVSERGGDQPNWFQDTINHSRLDNYYWFLASACAVNLVVYMVLRSIYASLEVVLEEGQDVAQEEPDWFSDAILM